MSRIFLCWSFVSQNLIKMIMFFTQSALQDFIPLKKDMSQQMIGLLWYRPKGINLRFLDIYIGP